MFKYKIAREFILWLKEQGIYEAYMKNYTHTDVSIAEFLSFSPDTFILRAFRWKQTKEGEMYWKNISDKWLKHLKKSLERYKTDRLFIEWLKVSGYFNPFMEKLYGDYRPKRYRDTRFLTSSVWGSLGVFSDITLDYYIEESAKGAKFWGNAKRKWIKYRMENEYGKI